MDAAMATAIASFGVACVAALSAWASSRAATNASTKNNEVNVEAKRLEQAYERARKFDIETIGRQDREIEELRDENDQLRAQVLALRLRVANLELRLPTDDEVKGGH